MNGTSSANAVAFAADTPTNNAPIKPGPTVAATASTRERSMLACCIACAVTCGNASRWARLAISGTTPPNRACSASWLATTDDNTSVPPITTATAVSSQLVSIPSTTVDSSTDTLLIGALFLGTVMSRCPVRLRSFADALHTPRFEYRCTT